MKINKFLIIISFISTILAISSSSFAYPQRCTLVNQSRNGQGSDTLVCDYQCEDGTSRTRYIHASYCPAAIGS